MSDKNFSRKQPSRLSTPVRLGVAAVAACFISGPVLSNPLNPTVVNGTAAFNQAGKVLTVTNTPGAIINWQKFSIQVGETTHFAQTSASSSVLNRVLSDPSAIYGTLSSNGRVWLVNPAGILVGPGGRVDVAAFVASTLNISNADFLAGRNVFINDGSAKNVINQGEIRTPAGGSVYLIGSNVANEGLITTPQGETILAAGATVSLIDSATPGIKVDITGADGNATNLGTITAEAGRIGIAGVIVRNSGTLNASSVVNEGGRIFLKASQDAYVDGNGRIVTTGTRGGSVEVLGNRVAVMDNAEIDASGTNGGGRILIGGDYQGKNPEIQNASITYFGPDATLKADATEVGDGGTVIVWADDTTRAYGSISARGGANGGNGGFVETSGKRYLDTPGIRIDVGASNGEGGLWLLDPSDINIVASGTSTTTESPPGVFSYGGTVGTLVDDDINAALTGGDVIVQTDGAGGGFGNITATGVSIYGGIGSYSLTLAAYGGGTATGDITITNSTIDVYDGVSLLAGWNGVSFAAGEINFTSSNVISGTGDINIAGSVIRSANPAVKTNLFAGHDINLSTYGGLVGTLVQGAMMDVFAGNNLTLTGGYGTTSNAQGPSVMLYSTGTQTVTATGSIVLQAGSVLNTTYAGSPSYGGSVVIEAGGNQSVSADTITVNGGTVGKDNAAAIRGGGATQTINVTTLLALTGGSGVNNNYASIDASGTNTVQTINATGADIVLTGGANGGILDFENSADIGLGDNNTGGSQTVYAGNITIDGGNADYGGAGFGTENGRNQFFYVSGNLTMTGGGGYSGNFRATPAYIGSENGGGTIIVDVGGDITLTGGYGTSGGVLIGSLSNSGTAVTIIAGNSVTIDGGEGGVGIGAIGPAISAGPAGVVYIASGSTVSAASDVTVYAQKSATINGTVESTGTCGDCGDGVFITAGYSPSIFNNTFGGDIHLGSQSVISGYSVGLTAISGTSAAGNIVQSPVGSITIDGNYSGYSNFFKADGNLLLDGVVVASDFSGGGGLYGYAGDSGAPGKTLRVSNISSPNGGYIGLHSTGDAVIGSIYAPTGYVDINADGAISDNNGTALNITADSIGLNSQYGGVAGGLAITMDTTAASSLTVNVTPFATYGGISIRNSGVGTVSIFDSASSQSNINFYNSGDLTLNGNFSTGGSTQIESGGTLNVIGAGISGYDVTLVAPTINITGGAEVFAVNAASLTGSEININGGFVTATNNISFTGATAGTGNLNVYGGDAAAIGPSGQLTFNLANVTASNYGGLTADGLTSNITGTVSGNITLDQGGFFAAGNDIVLTLTGANSTVSLSNGGFMLADYVTLIPATIYLTFLGRGSGGVLINGVPTTTTLTGGSGFFVVNTSTPATAGAGLEIVYGSPFVVDPCASSPDLCSPPVPIENPILEVVELVAVDPCASNPDSVECKLQSPDEEKDIFGGQEEFGTKDENWIQKTFSQCSI